MELKDDFKKNISGVYAITNKINNMSYIGCSKNIHRRMIEHKKPSASPSMKISIAIKKFGIENFRLDILEICEGKDMFKREEYWVKKNNSRYPNGYNMTDGGIGLNGFEHSLSTKNKIGKIHAGKVMSKDTRKKMSEFQIGLWNRPGYRESRSGEGSHSYGRKHSEESKVLMSEWQSGEKSWCYGRKLPEKQALLLKQFRKDNAHKWESPIYMMDKYTKEIIMSFDSLKKGAEWIAENTKYKKAGGGRLSTVCNGHGETAYGYRWKFNGERIYKNGK